MSLFVVQKNVVLIQSMVVLQDIVCLFIISLLKCTIRKMRTWVGQIKNNDSLCPPPSGSINNCPCEAPGTPASGFLVVCVFLYSLSEWESAHSGVMSQP